MEVNDDNTQRFWQWFVKNEKVIKSCIEKEDVAQREKIVDQLNEHILSLGVFSWDIGLDDANRWFLMISPNGNSDMLAVSQTIMDQAPDHMNWLFYSGKPALDWKRQFTIYDEYMDEQFIDANQWYFLAFEEDDGIELVIEVKNLPHLDPDTVETAAEQFVIQELGERTRILKISSVIVVPEFDPEDESDKMPIQELKTYLADLI